MNILQLHEDFIVHRTRSAKETAKYIDRLTRFMKRKYESKSLKSCPVELWPTVGQIRLFIQIDFLYLR